jgi:putative membrane protein
MTLRSWTGKAAVAAVILGGGLLGACSDKHHDSDNHNSSGRSAQGMTMQRTGTAEQRILSRLHAENMEEIQVGQLAQSRGSSDAARRYGQHLVQDHTRADGQVLQTARAAGVTLMPVDEVKRMKAQEKGMSTPPDPVAELSRLSGADFDRTMAMRMRDGHRDLIMAVERARNEVSDANVRSLLDQMLPTLRHHEQMAADMIR